VLIVAYTPTMYDFADEGVVLYQHQWFAVRLDGEVPNTTRLFSSKRSQRPSRQRVSKGTVKLLLLLSRRPLGIAICSVSCTGADVTFDRHAREVFDDTS
jgi:hypothetical protein